MKVQKMSPVYRLVLSALFLSIGLVLPFLTGQIQQIGSMLLPMHLPVMLCGLICGWKYGLVVGAVMPIFRSLLFSMPILFPNAIAMSFELATYGFVIGFLFSRAKWQCILSLYRCLVISMLAGRAVWGAAMVCMMGLGETGFTFTAFIGGAFLNAIPGIAVQFVLIPAVMLLLDRTHLVPFRNNRRHRHTSPAEDGQ